MECKPNPAIKNYCYKSPECEIVETGAVQSTWLVCRSCKEEVTEELSSRVKKVSEPQEDSDLESIYYGWGI